MMKVNCEHRFSVSEGTITLREIYHDRRTNKRTVREVLLSEFLHDTYFYTHHKVSLEVDGILLYRSADLEVSGETASFWNTEFHIPHMVTEIIDKQISFIFTGEDGSKFPILADREKIMGGNYNPRLDGTPTV